MPDIFTFIILTYRSKRKSSWHFMHGVLIYGRIIKIQEKFIFPFPFFLLPLALKPERCMHVEIIFMMGLYFGHIS